MKKIKKFFRKLFPFEARFSAGMIFFVSALMWISQLNFAPAVYASDRVPDTFTGKKLLLELVGEKALKYGVSKDDMIGVINCENKDWVTDKQSDLPYTFSDPSRGIVKGSRERSFGLAMYHIPDHADMTVEDATNPDYALDRMARDFKAGKQSWMWKICWAKYQGN